MRNIRAFSTLSLVLWVLQLLDQVIAQEPASMPLVCHFNQVLVWSAESARTKCLDCPVGCSLCIALGDKPVCSGCVSGKYLSSGVCRNCATGCASCRGPEPGECVELDRGYFWSDSEKIMNICTMEGCASCNAAGQCTRCKPGYRAAVLFDGQGKKRMEGVHELFNCYKCSKEECSDCNIDSIGIEMCYGCNSGYGLNRNLNICQKCLPGCFMCYSNPAACDQCDEGYFKSRESSTCVIVTIPNCKIQYPGKDKKECEVCDPGYFIHPLNKNECISCATEENKLCTSCVVAGTIPSEKTEMKKQLVCNECPTGFAPPTKSNQKCLPCPSGCYECESVDKCRTCQPGFVLDVATNKCRQETDLNCLISSSKGGCELCNHGYFLDASTQKCVACDSSCYTCRGSGTSSCIMCPITKAFFETKPTADDGIYYLTNRTCVDSCPPEFKGDTYKMDTFTRECLQTNQKPDRNKTTYQFTRTTTDVSARTILQDSFAFVEQLKKYIDEITRKARDWATTYPESAKLFPAECTHHGTLLEKVNPYRETYYGCKCDVGYFGPTCDMDRELHEQVQKFIDELVLQMRNYCNSATVLDLIDALSFLNLAPSISPSNLLNMLSFIKGHVVSRFQHEMRDSFIRLVDLLIRSMYRQLAERENAAGTDIADDKLVFASQFSYMISELSEPLQSMAFKSFFLNQSFANSPSKAFQISITPGTPSIFTDVASPLSTSWAQISPSDLLGLSQETRAVEYVWVVTPDWYSTENDIKKCTVCSQMASAGILYSALLFNSGHIDAQGFIASHVIKPSVASSNTRQSLPVDEKLAKGVRLLARFPLRVLPSDTAAQEKLSCLVMRLLTNDTTAKLVTELVGKPTVEIDSKTKKYSAVCLFDSKFVSIGLDFTTGRVGGDLYFAVGWKGLNDDDSDPARIRRTAMDELDNASDSLPDLDPKLFIAPDSSATIPLSFTALSCAFLALTAYF